ncbi:MAG: RNA 2',3'-cyclic phosphodiesterase [Gemmatimonadetes bacterium]|nr:RNA 2',3'-cyclic phosphodiesterase [Gemmatimonadota bacterium]
MRLFVALSLPKKERQRIHKEAATLRERGLPVRWVEPDHYHLTLKFLGEVRPDRVERIDGLLTKIARSNAPFPVEMGGFGAFPTIRRPRVIWLGVEPSPALRCLKQDVEWALAEIGFDRETRAFHPHLTLGRVDEEGGAGAFRGLDEVTASMGYEASFEVKSLELMRSHLSRSGARYSVVASRNLSDGS